MSNVQSNRGIFLGDRSDPPEQVRIIAGLMVCPECIRDSIMPLFRAALDYEHHYPPKWSKIVIQFDDFRQFLTQAEHAEWELKLAEYSTPPSGRVYRGHKLQGPATDDGTSTWTDCNTFVSTLTLEGGASPCRKREGWSCRKCGVRYEVPADGETDDDSMEIEHACKEKEADILNDDALEGYYQRCPKPDCGFIISPGAGCNAMDCHRFSTTFCYLCGDITTHESNYWALGSRFPCFGKPDSPNAIFDNAPAPGEQVLLAFRVNRDHILRFDAVDDGKEIQKPQRANDDTDSPDDLVRTTHDLVTELQGAFGSVEGAPRPLSAFHRLLELLVINLGHIFAVERGWEIAFSAQPRPYTSPEWAARLARYERFHEELAVNYDTAFFEAIRHVEPGSTLLRIRNRIFRVREMFDVYMAWDMTGYATGALILQPHHQRRNALPIAQL